MKKKSKAGFLIIEGDVWPYDVVVALGTTKEQFIEYTDRKFVTALSKEDKDKLKFDGQGMTVMLSNFATIMWLKDYPETPKGFGILAHEIFHVADVILWKAGLNLSQDSDESWAYLIDWLTRRIYEEYGLC